MNTNAWLRLWFDMPTSPIFRTIARKSGRSISEVMSVYTFLLVNAGKHSTSRDVTRSDARVTHSDLPAGRKYRGTVIDWDSEGVATALDIDEEDVDSILEAMEGRVLEEWVITGWEKRQPKREDSSSERTKTYRKRRNSKGNGSSDESNDGDVTHSDAQEHTVTHVDAPVTQSDARSRSRRDPEEKKEPPIPPAGGIDDSSDSDMSDSPTSTEGAKPDAGAAAPLAGNGDAAGVVAKSEPDSGSVAVEAAQPGSSSDRPNGLAGEDRRNPDSPGTVLRVAVSDPQHDDVPTLELTSQANGAAEPPAEPRSAKRTRNTKAPVEIPDWVPAQQWADYVEYRKAGAKRKFTDAAANLNLRKLAQLRETGEDPALVLETAIERSWSGLFPVPDAIKKLATPAPNQPATSDAEHYTKPDDYTPGQYTEAEKKEYGLI